MATSEPIPTDFELDLARYELRRDGRVERLEKLPMELLILLSERRGQLVTRAEILERLWGREVSLSADAAINTAVRKVRRALGDDPDAPRFLETVVGKGYRFVGGITLIPATEKDASPGTRVDARPGARRRRLGIAALALAGVAVVGALGVLRSRGGPALDSVAVLPFENTGGDANAEYLSDG